LVVVTHLWLTQVQLKSLEELAQFQTIHKQDTTKPTRNDQDLEIHTTEVTPCKSVMLMIKAIATIRALFKVLATTKVVCSAVKRSTLVLSKENEHH